MEKLYLIFFYIGLVLMIVSVVSTSLGTKAVQGYMSGIIFVVLGFNFLLRDMKERIDNRNYLLVSNQGIGGMEMIIKMGFCHPDNIQYIRCPAKVGRKINKLYWEFLAWMYDRNNDHGHWEPAGEDNNGEVIYGVSYGGIDFVNWLNNVRYARRKKKVATHLWTTRIPPRKKIWF